MKIAVIGNMNNNGFALMRYFRDLGADAHLLLNANDGRGTLAHFRPENDTWDIAAWCPYIHQTSIPNAPIAALGFPYAQMISAMSRSQQPVSVAQIRHAYSGYDRFVTSGIIPAVMHRAGLRPDIFFPYSTGIEFSGSKEFVDRIKGLRAVPLRAVAKAQARGIRSAHAVLNAEMGLTHTKLQELGVQPQALGIPMVYLETGPKALPNPRLRALREEIAAHDMTVLHHARLMWENPGYAPQNWEMQNKHNDYAIHGFAQLCMSRPKAKLLLIVLEYGPNIAATKRLVAELGIEKQVRWLPKMPRKEILWLLRHVTASFGEFYEMHHTLWGGTGWEAMAAGVPVIQNFRFEDDAYERLFGTPPPPLMAVRRREDICHALEKLYDAPDHAKHIGAQLQGWFHAHNGRSMAQRWLSVLESKQ